MSLSQSFFQSETEEILHPQFTRALKGFNVAEVDSYVVQAQRRIEVLETHLDKVLEERDRLRHELVSAKADVYRNAGERLAGILRSIDDHVDGVRRQADEDARRRVAEAERHAETLKREAEEESARIRAEAAAVLEEANIEAARVLGELTDRRDAVQAEIGGLRDRLRLLLEQLEAPPADTEPAAVSAEGEDETVSDDSADEPEDSDADADGDWAVQIDTEIVDLPDIGIEDGLGS